MVEEGADADHARDIARRREVALNTLKSLYGVRQGSNEDLILALSEALGTHPPGLEGAIPMASPAAASAAAPERDAAQAADSASDGAAAVHTVSRRSPSSRCVISESRGCCSSYC